MKEAKQNSAMKGCHGFHVNSYKDLEMQIIVALILLCKIKILFRGRKKYMN